MSASKGIARPRIVKGRTAKQRAVARQFGPRYGLFRRQAIAPPPARSWWLDLAGEAFSQAAAAERARIQHSKFSRPFGTETMKI